MRKIATYLFVFLLMLSACREPFNPEIENGSFQLLLEFKYMFCTCETSSLSLISKLECFN